jgi:hypothetical protein
MPGLTKKYRLRKRRAAADVYEFLDLESGSLVGVASPAAVETAARGLGGTILDVLLSFRLSRHCVMAVALVLSPFWFAGAILGIWPFQSRASRPRLIVRRPDDEGVVFTLRVSSGLMYDSRRVYDGQGGLIAHFRSQSTSTVRGRFEMIDLMGCEDDDRDIGCRPGSVASNPRVTRRVYRLLLADNPDTGRITRHADQYDIGASPAMRHDATSEILLLVATLTVAWSPRG